MTIPQQTSSSPVDVLAQTESFRTLDRPTLELLVDAANIDQVAESTAIHHLTNADVADAPVIEEVLPDVVRFIGHSVLVGHHVNFDLRFLNKTLRKQGLCRLRHPWLDTMMLYSAVSGRLGHYTLEEVAGFCQVELWKRHTPYGDAVMTALMFKWLGERLTNGRHPVSKLIKWQTQVGFF